MKMAIICGIYIRNNSDSKIDCLSKELKKIVHRNETNKVISIKKKNIIIYIVDLNIENICIHEDLENESISVILGDPLCLDMESKNRSNIGHSAKQIFREIKIKNYDTIKNSRGVFSAVFYDAKIDKFFLVSDKLGIRPVYYYVGEKYAVFSSTLWVLEKFSIVPKIMDMRGVTELINLGFPLGNRTPYSQIKLIKGSEIIEISKEKHCLCEYWQWGNVSKVEENEEIVLQRVFEEFDFAIAIRAKDEKDTIAMLSGGLDSRCVVAQLIKRGIRVYSLNFSRKNSLDQLYARSFANAVKTNHMEFIKEIDPNWSKMVAVALNKMPNYFGNVKHARRVWSGDGGSVGLGHVYMDNEIISFMRKKDNLRAIERYLASQKIKISKKMFRLKIFQEIKDILEVGIAEELKGIQSYDPGRDFYFFLMLNDQRRHLSRHFEEIDINQVELQLPFFDSKLIETISRAPIDIFIGHKFYHEFLKKFQEEVTNVAWQTYPNHEKCPVKNLEQDRFEYQFSENVNKDISNILRKNIKIKDILFIARDRNLKRILNTINVTSSLVITKVGIKDYWYIFKAANCYQKYLHKSSNCYKL
jgi:hypothetical protein